jgi:hypothetical protein
MSKADFKESKSVFKVDMRYTGTRMLFNVEVIQGGLSGKAGHVDLCAKCICASLVTKKSDPVNLCDDCVHAALKSVYEWN